MRRKLLATLALVVLIAGAGCLGSGPSDENLAENATYNWNSTYNVSITLEEGTARSVYAIDNATELEVYDRDTFGNPEPLSDLSALQFRYPNGTVVNASAFDISSGQRTTLELPARDGQVGFTVDRIGKTLETPVFIEGSYEVFLPPDTSIGIPLLAKVSPGGFNTSTVADRTVVRWENVESDDLLVQYYLNRDVIIFGGIALIALGIATGGGLYYWREIRQLEKRREDVGLEVDDEDDDPRDRGPPPGMR